MTAGHGKARQVSRFLSFGKNKLLEYLIESTLAKQGIADVVGVQREQIGGCSGFIYDDGKERCVLYSNDLPCPLFTVLHEIGHCVLECIDQEPNKNWNSESEDMVDNWAKDFVRPFVSREYWQRIQVLQGDELYREVNMSLREELLDDSEITLRLNDGLICRDDDRVLFSFEKMKIYRLNEKAFAVIKLFSTKIEASFLSAIWSEYFDTEEKLLEFVDQCLENNLLLLEHKC
jgi:hypothetical protein